ncbi:hypothetical protein BJV74DRAFT_116790 [Russula compacta]|nr:hypothetical protein BJV74DRAFT_116790 [Russula compacta]
MSPYWSVEEPPLLLVVLQARGMRRTEKFKFRTMFSCLHIQKRRRCGPTFMTHLHNLLDPPSMARLLLTIRNQYNSYAIMTFSIECSFPAVSIADPMKVIIGGYPLGLGLTHQNVDPPGIAIPWALQIPSKRQSVLAMSWRVCTLSSQAALFLSAFQLLTTH